MQSDLQYIIATNSFRICPLVDADSFVSYCKKRGLDTSEKELERLEELGLFYPMARSDSWPYQIKIKTSEVDGSYQDLGTLEEGDEWSGEVMTRNARLSFSAHDPNEWLASGHLWEPRSREFQKWNGPRDSDDRASLRSHYSIFQVYELWFLRQLLTMKLKAIWWSDAKASQLAEWAAEQLDLCKNLGPRGSIPYLCQLLSNRYFPPTQTNQRQFNLRAPRGFEWDKFCDSWDDRKLLDDLNLTTDTVRHWWGMIMLDAKTRDPLEDWYDFVQYIALRKREELKGEAQLAQSLYHMEHMVRLWHNALTGEKLPTPSGPVTYKFAPGAETEVKRDHLLFLERLANEYNVNPNPRVIFAVEGESEFGVLPRIIKEYFGFSVDGIGIQFVKLGGVGNFEGKKGYDRDSALVRFVDDYHERGVIVFILMDNEGRVAQVANRLTNAHSIYDSKRRVTRPEYVHVWNANIEFDSFSNTEIAQALTDLGKNTYAFSESDVHCCRPNTSNRRSKSLESLYAEKVPSGFGKPELLEKLVEMFVLQKTEDGTTSQRRPLLDVVHTVLQLAHENFASDNPHEIEARRQRGLYGQIDQEPPSDSNKSEVQSPTK